MYIAKDGSETAQTFESDNDSTAEAASAFAQHMHIVLEGAGGCWRALYATSIRWIWEQSREQAGVLGIDARPLGLVVGR